MLFPLCGLLARDQSSLSQDIADDPYVVDSDLSHAFDQLIQLNTASIPPEPPVVAPVLSLPSCASSSDAASSSMPEATVGLPTSESSVESLPQVSVPQAALLPQSTAADR
eukprot:12431013-Karenia_brevis.AAC.1